MKYLLLSIALWFSITSMQAQEVAMTYELTLDGAKEILASARQYAEAAHAPGASIAIVDAAGTLVYFERLNGSFPISSEVSIGKARSAALFRFPTLKLEEGINNGRPALLSVGEVSLKGGLPIVYDGKVIGGIGVSGAASADQDVEIANAGLKAKFLAVAVK